MAYKLAEQGANITLVDRKEEPLIAFASELKAVCRRPDTQLNFAIADMSRPDHVSWVVRRTKARAGEGGIDGLVNCVGCDGRHEDEPKYFIKKKGTAHTFESIAPIVDNMFSGLSIPVPMAFTLKVAESMWRNALRGGDGTDAGAASSSGSSSGDSSSSGSSLSSGSDSDAGSQSDSSAGYDGAQQAPPSGPGSVPRMETFGKVGGDPGEKRRGIFFNFSGRFDMYLF